MAPKRGLGDAGRRRLNRNWEDINNDEPSEDGWLTGKQYEEFEEGRLDSDIDYRQLTTPEDVYPLEDKRDGSNYGFGPKFSTRVIKHLFKPDNPEGLNRLAPGLGTVYVMFQKRNDVYAYFNVPFNVYEDFARSTSKGRFINHTMNNYLDSSRSNLNGDTSVFNP